MSKIEWLHNGESVTDEMLKQLLCDSKINDSENHHIGGFTIPPLDDGGCIGPRVSISPDRDLISRQQAINLMQDKAKGISNTDTVNGLCGAVAILFEMPAVNPINKTCENCYYNYGLRENDDCNPDDILCDYWESDGLTKNDYCSQWREVKKDDR